MIVAIKWFRSFQYQLWDCIIKIAMRDHLCLILVAQWLRCEKKRNILYEQSRHTQTKYIYIYIYIICTSSNLFQWATRQVKTNAHWSEGGKTFDNLFPELNFKHENSCRKNLFNSSMIIMNCKQNEYHLICWTNR